MRAALGDSHVEYAVGCNVTNVSWGGIGGGTVHHPPKGVPPHQGVSPEEAQAHIDAAVALAKKSDVAVLGLGLRCGRDRSRRGGCRRGGRFLDLFRLGRRGGRRGTFTRYGRCHDTFARSWGACGK